MTTIGARIDRLIQEKQHDTYRTKGKLSEPTCCPDCGAVYHQGRWQWLESRPTNAHEIKCPACQRISDRVPAGFVSISGEFFQSHRDEILGLIRNIESEEKKQHPLNRIMQLSDEGAGLEITTTDMHLPRDIGVALEKAYDGELDFHYVDESNLLRVKWQR
ncbi:MAG: BCAM0308 family protein [Gammaproteobacteria bacterium]|nr:BCAM0308 family protein [Gammaproteobacteria bacterium]